MSEVANVPNTPGASKIEYVLHANESGQTDITLFTGRIDIHSDISFQGGSQCYIQVADYENLLEKLQFTSGDAVSFSVRYGARSYERKYRIKRITDFVNLENGKAYSLHLVSELEFASYSVKISRYYSGRSDQVALGIFNNYTREGHHLWEQSIANIDYIVPTLSPFRTLKTLANKSRSLHSPSSFVFYQDSHQFWSFTSLPNLKKTQKSIETFRYFQNADPDRNGIPDISLVKNTIQNLKYFPAFDIQQEIEAGTLKNTDYTFDLTTKSVTVTQNSYWDTYRKNSLNPRMVWKEETLDVGSKTYSVQATASIGERRELGFPGDEVSPVEHVNFSAAQQIEINIYGNNQIDIGQIVNIEIPEQSPQSGGPAKLDKVWSGAYYVVAKHDAIDKSGHSMALRLTKDSFI